MITIVTHAALPNGAPDDLLLAQALVGLGSDVRFAVWNDPQVDWTLGDVTVIRSTWDYHLYPADWFAWLERTAQATRLVNPPALLRWNSSKTYLLALQQAGIPVIPTILLECASTLTGSCAERGWTDVVVKPVMSASSYGARRFAGDAIDDEGSHHARKLISRGGALLQPYRPAVETARERSLVFFGGVYSHAFSKPAFHAGLGDAALLPHQPSAAELTLAHQVFPALPEPPVVARLDLLPGASGPELMEVELIEPQLACHLHHEAAATLARALNVTQMRSRFRRRAF
jgi:glutathione synthase/RimK-type ligase-like ATP-grasp enzyme